MSNYKFKVDGLDCANCAAKIEDKIKNVDGVTDVTLSYITQKLKLEVNDDFDINEIKSQAISLGRNIEPEFEII